MASAQAIILCAIQRTPNIQCFGAPPESCCTINELQKSYLPISIVLPMSMQQHAATWQTNGAKYIQISYRPHPISEFVRSNDFIEEQVKGVINQSKFYQDTRNSKRLSKSWYLCSWSPTAGQPLRPCFKRLMCIRKCYECNMISFLAEHFSLVVRAWLPRCSSSNCDIQNFSFGEDTSLENLGSWTTWILWKQKQTFSSWRAFPVVEKCGEGWEQRAPNSGTFETKRVTNMCTYIIL